jgi:hypothetical protein
MLHEKRSILPSALTLALLAVLIGVIPVGASSTPVGSPSAPVHVVPADACSSLTAVPSPNPSPDDVLTGVSAPTTSFAWAAGYQGNGSGLNQTLIEQWNGSAWSVVKSPNPSINNYLLGVAQVGKSGHFWSVGYYNNYSNDNTLILHC